MNVLVAAISYALVFLVLWMLATAVWVIIHKRRYVRVIMKPWAQAVCRNDEIACCFYESESERFIDDFRTGMVRMFLWPRLIFRCYGTELKGLATATRSNVIAR